MSTDSEDVADFLRRIKELNEKRDQEDAERTRKLEEEIMEGRKQREARRLERARSLSPEKRDSLSGPQTPRSPRNFPRSDITKSPLTSPPILSPPVLSEPVPLHSASRERAALEHRDTDLTAVLQADSGRLPSYTGTLSRQQKSLVGLRSRPISVIDRATSPLGRQIATPPPPADLSRDQISQNLAAKDPSWFRQSSERPERTAGFRRNLEDTEGIHTAQRRALPGMGRSTGPAKQENTTAEAEGAAPPIVSLDDTSTSVTSISKLGSIDHGSRAVESGNGDAATRLLKEPPLINRPSHDRPDRSMSPTKGLGGFVQSAMKRSDSVSKRWSVQTPTGLSRQGSNASLRDGGKTSRPPENLGISDVRPHIEAAKAEREAETPYTPTKLGSKNLALNGDRTLRHARSESFSLKVVVGDNKLSENTAPGSPSKRWSPVKSSWLESALSRPSSPQSTTASPQPAWLSELNKTKQQRNSADVLQHNSQIKDSADALPTKGSLATKNPPAKPKPMSLREKPAGFTLAEADTSTSSNILLKPSVISPSEVRRDAPTLKPKSRPEVALKPDLRSNLRAITTPAEAPKKEELEFRNAFGKLKRTQPERYVPPDELKENILRGKRDLSPTKGPQTGPRKDELKESLIKQRQNLAANSSIPKAPLLSPGHDVIPTASKRIMHRLDHETANDDKHSTEPDLPSLPLRHAMTFPPDDRTAEGKPTDEFQSNLVAVLARATANGTRVQSFSNKAHEGQLNTSSRPSQFTEKSATPLEHMTKGRARGPKRRLPNASVAVNPSTTVPSIETKKPTPRAKSMSLRQVTPSQTTRGVEIPAESMASTPKTPPKISSAAEHGKSPDTNARPLLPPRVRSGQSDGLHRSPSLPVRPSKPSDLRSISGSASSPVQKRHPSENLPQNIPTGEVHRSSSPPVEETAARSGRVPLHTPVDSSNKLRAVTTSVRNNDMPSPNSSLRRAGTVLGSPMAFGIAKRGPNMEKPAVAGASPLHALTTRQTNERPHPPAVGRKPSSAIVSLQANGLSVHHSDTGYGAKQVFADFFSNTTSTNGPIDFGTQGIVDAHTVTIPKIKTLRKEISELSLDGQRSPLPLQQDHILYSRNCYICTHIFGDATGARVTEVYLWAGSAVPDSAVEEIETHARKVARDAGGKFQKFRQGKESSNFLQALGGILITRYGNVQDNKNSYMICGRRHLGHITFDEVELSDANLCSGFPFIISSRSTNTIYLWKGTGCNPDELAGARLMSMDLGLESSVVEVEEGREPQDFHRVFPAATAGRIQQESYWKLKATNSSYHVRLFRIERPASQGSAVTTLWNRVRQPTQAGTAMSSVQIQEVAPFCESDFEPENIYVLDAFFEVHVLVGPLAQEKYQPFAAALLFAQDYAIIAASTQDRPSVPSAKVFMLDGAIPRHMRPVFRQYGGPDGLSTSALMAGKARGSGEDSTKEFTLSDAIAATRT